MPNPTLYTDAIAEGIVERLWAGEALTSICRGEGMPSPRTVRDWTVAHPEFGEAYKAAMVGGAYALIEETTEIVDNLEERPESRKVRAWQRFELAKRKAPHVLGDKVTLAGDPEAPLHGMTDEALDERLNSLLKKALDANPAGGDI